MLVAAGTSLHPRSLSPSFIEALNLFHNLVTEPWHVTAEGGSSALHLNSLHLHWTCNLAIQYLEHYTVHGFISDPTEAS
jgi:hypothetical protein